MTEHEVIMNKKSVTPYKMLLGAIFKQLIQDALMQKYYYKLRKEVRMYPERFTYDRKTWIEKCAVIGGQARRTIMSKGLEELISGSTIHMDPNYFRKKYLAQEEEVYKIGYEKFASNKHRLKNNAV